LIDRAVEHVLRLSGGDYSVEDFVPYGYDERQYCSPGFDLRVGCLMRTPNGRYPQYHTSADDLELVKPEALSDSLSKCEAIVEILEKDRAFLNQNPYCEPQLGKRGLYRGMGGSAELPGFEMAMLWVLNLSDGDHTLLEIADRAGIPFRVVAKAAEALEGADLLRPAEPREEAAR